MKIANRLTKLESSTLQTQINGITKNIGNMLPLNQSEGIQ